MRIYCDSNIFRKAKKTSSQFNNDVFNAMESIRNEVVFLFSEAHLDDLSKSHEDFRNEDLNMMEYYVKNNYISRNHVKKTIGFLLATPLEAYKSIDYTASEKIMENPYEYIQNFFDEAGDESQLYKAIFDIPVFSLSHIESSNVPEENQPLLNELKDLRTVNDFLKYMGDWNSSLNSPNHFRNQQKLLSNFIDRDTYSYEQWSFDFDEKMKDTEFGKSFTELVDLIIPESNKQDDYTCFINTYVGLESLGVTKEKSGKKGKVKRNSFSDLYKDASHAFFASQADYFVTSDIGALTKAFIVYKLFKINTQVLSPKDFMAKAPFILKNEDNSSSFFKGLVMSLRNGLILYQSDILQQHVIKLLYPVFNYFDRMQVNKSGENIQMFKSRDTDHGIMYAEIKLLIKKCNRIFGPALGLKHEESLTELADYKDEEPIKSWEVGDINISIAWKRNNYNERIIVLELMFNQYSI